MIKYTYLACLLFSIGGLTLADWKYKLALFYDAKKAITTVGISLLLFLIWDLIGIYNGVFFTGDSRFDTEIILLPELPLEEVFFLILLSYFTLILWRILQKR